MGEKRKRRREEYGWRWFVASNNTERWADRSPRDGIGPGSRERDETRTGASAPRASRGLLMLNANSLSMVQERWFERWTCTQLTSTSRTRLHGAIKPAKDEAGGIVFTHLRSAGPHLQLPFWGTLREPLPGLALSHTHPPTRRKQSRAQRASGRRQ